MTGVIFLMKMPQWIQVSGYGNSGTSVAVAACYGVAAGAGALFGVERYPLTSCFELIVFTTIS